MLQLSLHPLSQHLPMSAVSNHGVSEALVTEAFDEYKKFFALPDEQKRAILADKNNRCACSAAARYQASNAAGMITAWSYVTPALRHSSHNSSSSALRRACD